jgi:hypothetical protein
METKPSFDELKNNIENYITNQKIEMSINIEKNILPKIWKLLRENSLKGLESSFYKCSNKQEAQLLLEKLEDNGFTCWNDQYDLTKIIISHYKDE